jgi:lipopolysaccharide/colanic/teichoic acid biosynthesis glycosyltransferase
MSKMPYKIIKQLSDTLLSFLLLILLSPLFLLISFLIWLGDRDKIYVKEPLRIGLYGKEFRMYKFRTMIPDAHREILENPKYVDLKKKWEGNGNKLKIDEDVRITRVGRILRKTDLDELPQLINVLIGQMSIVGPRPMYKDELERHLKSNPKDKKYLKDIFSVKPGITGLWQVSGRNEIPFNKRLKMDAEYAKKQSFLLDIKILLKTPYVVLTRKGAYE